jgi:hypothetical protein
MKISAKQKKESKWNWRLIKKPNWIYPKIYFLMTKGTPN